MNRRIDNIEKKMAVLKARKATLLAAEKKLERKRDARRKIILGAIVLKMAREDEGARNRFLKMIDGMSDNDKKLFDGYFENV